MLACINCLLFIQFEIVWFFIEWMPSYGNLDILYDVMRFWILLKPSVQLFFDTALSRKGGCCVDTAR